MQATSTGPEAIVPTAIPSAPGERFGYSYGVRSGSTVYISGMVAFNSAGEIVGEGDVSAQAAQVFENLRAVIEEAGGSLDDLVSTTTYMVESGHSLEINEVRLRYLTAPVKPTSTLLTVAALARPEFLVEISAVAELRS